MTANYGLSGAYVTTLLGPAAAFHATGWKSADKGPEFTGRGFIA